MTEISFAFSFFSPEKPPRLRGQEKSVFSSVDDVHAGSRSAGYITDEITATIVFGTRNLKYMRAFAEAYPDEQFVQQVIAQLPWGHNVRILEMVKAPECRSTDLVMRFLHPALSVLRRIWISSKISQIETRFDRKFIQM